MGSGHVGLSLQVGFLFTTLQYCVQLVDHSRLSYVPFSNFSHGLISTAHPSLQLPSLPSLLNPHSIPHPSHHYSSLLQSPLPPITTHPSLQFPSHPSLLNPHSIPIPSITTHPSLQLPVPPISSLTPAPLPTITHPHALPVSTPFFSPQKKVSCTAGTQ